MNKANSKFVSSARYSRQTLALGKAGQEKVRALAIGIAGLGGVGGTAALLCAQLGVRKLVVADFDCVDASNLGRQALYCEKDLGKQKAKIAKAALCRINPKVKIDAHVEFIDEKSAAKIFKDCQIILDCTDNQQARKAVSAYCAKAKKPLVYAGAIGTEAMAALVLPKGAAAFEKMIAKECGEAATCKTVGVLNTACAFAAAMQVQLMIGWATGKKAGEKLVYFDAENLDTYGKKL